MKIDSNERNLEVDTQQVISNVQSRISKRGLEIAYLEDKYAVFKAVRNEYDLKSAHKECVDLRKKILRLAKDQKDDRDIQRELRHLSWKNGYYQRMIRSVFEETTVDL